MEDRIKQLENQITLMEELVAKELKRQYPFDSPTINESQFIKDWNLILKK